MEFCCFRIELLDMVTNTDYNVSGVFVYLTELNL